MWLWGLLLGKDLFPFPPKGPSFYGDLGSCSNDQKRRLLKLTGIQQGDFPRNRTPRIAPHHAHPPRSRRADPHALDRQAGIRADLRKRKAHAYIYDRASPKSPEYSRKVRKRYAYITQAVESFALEISQQNIL